MEIKFCKHCNNKVLPTAEGYCPQCKKTIEDSPVIQPGDLRNNKNHEIEFSKSYKISPQYIHDKLKENFPSTAIIMHSETNPTKIKIKQGLWRGVKFSAHIEELDVKVNDLTFYIPSFIGRVITFIFSILLFSTIITIGVSISMKEFTLIGVLPGAIPGVFIWHWIDRAIVSSFKRSWSAELDKVTQSIMRQNN